MIIRSGNPFELFFQTENVSPLCDLWATRMISRDLIKFQSVPCLFYKLYLIMFFCCHHFCGMCICLFCSFILNFCFDLQLDKLRPEFRSGLDALTRFIFERTRPKQVGATVMTGPIFARITQSYLDALNKGVVPTITSSWQVSVVSGLRCVVFFTLFLTSADVWYCGVLLWLDDLLMF